MKHLKVLLVLLMFAAAASATTLHVGAGQTYSTIPEAFANVVAGDTIEIHEGTYTEFPNVSGSGTGLNNITFQRHGDDVVVVDLASYIYMRYRTGNKFIGLIFDATDTGGHGIYLRSSTHYTQFIDCVFYGAASAGIYAYGGSGWITGIVVDNCTFYSCGTGILHNNFVSSTVVTDCLFVNNTTACNAMSNYPFTVETSAFWNNTTDVAGYAAIGTGCLTNVEPFFVSTSIASADFLVLSAATPPSITAGASNGSFMGARGLDYYPLCGHAGTVPLGDVAGPDGVGEAHLDCRVDLYDFDVMTGRSWGIETNIADANTYYGVVDFINVKTDPVWLNICAYDAAGDGVTDDTGAIQASINYLTSLGGGTVYLPAGEYRTQGLVLADNVTLSGETDPNLTILRPRLSAGSMVSMPATGATLANMTIYGTADPNSDNWHADDAAGIITHNISTAGADTCAITNVRSLECAYDPLYFRSSDNVTVSNCWFDRAGRNIVSIVNSQDWTFEDCYFGSAWGLYHVDMESTLAYHHNEDGHFLRCVFDGVTRGTVPGTYAGANWLIFVGDTGAFPANSITVEDCEFRQVYIRIRNEYGNCAFLNNTFNNDQNVIFRATTGDVTDFFNATVSGNTFRYNGIPITSLTMGDVSFTNATFTNNDPDTWDD